MSTTAEIQYPITVEEALDFCRVGESNKQFFETELIPTVFEILESQTGRSFSRQNHTDHFENWDGGKLCLNHCPVCEIIKFESTDNDGCWRELNQQDFEWQLTGSMPWVRRKCGECPCDPCGCPPRYRITYSAGCSPCSVPHRAKMAMLMLISSLNNYRGSDIESNIKTSPIFERIIRTLRKPSFVT